MKTMEDVLEVVKLIPITLYVSSLENYKNLEHLLVEKTN